MPSRERANGGSAAEASDVRACEIADGASPTARKSVISAVVKLRREQIRMAPLCSRDRKQRQLPTMEIYQRQGTWQAKCALQRARCRYLFTPLLSTSIEKVAA